MTGANPTDRGKSGTKRHVLTDQKGIPLSVSITGANTHDMKAAIDTLDTMIVQRPSYKQGNSSVTPYSIIMKCLLESILLYHSYMKDGCTILFSLHIYRSIFLLQKPRPPRIRLLE